MILNNVIHISFHLCPGLCSINEPIRTLRYWTVHGASLLINLGVFECNIEHRRSVLVLCMLYKFRCNQMHPLYGAQHVLYMQVRVARGPLVFHRYTYAPPRCRTSQYCKTFVPRSSCISAELSCFMTMYLITWDRRVLRTGPMLFTKSSETVFYLLLFSILLSIGWFCGAGVFGLIGCLSLSHSLEFPTSFNNNNTNNKN